MSESEQWHSDMDQQWYGDMESLSNYLAYLEFVECQAELYKAGHKDE